MSSRVVTRYGINWNVKLEGPSLDTESTRCSTWVATIQSAFAHSGLRFYILHL